LDVLVLLEVIERERRSVASAGTRTVIHLMTADRRSMPLLLLLVVNSPLFAAGRHHQRRLVSAVLPLLLLDAAVSTVLRAAGIGIQRVFRSPLAAVVIIIRLIVVIVMVLVIAGR
jgi:hypothetical protein